MLGSGAMVLSSVAAVISMAMLATPGSAGVVDYEFQCVTGVVCVGVIDYHSGGPTCGYFEATGVVVTGSAGFGYAQALGSCSYTPSGTYEYVALQAGAEVAGAEVEFLWLASEFHPSGPAACTMRASFDTPVTPLVSETPATLSGGQLDACPAGPPPDLAGDHV